MQRQFQTARGYDIASAIKLEREIHRNVPYF